MGNGKRGPGSNRRPPWMAGVQKTQEQIFCLQADYGSAALPLSYPARSSCGGLWRFVCWKFSKSRSRTDNKISLLLTQDFLPLRNSTTCKPQCASQFCCGPENINRFFFVHGLCLANSTENVNLHKHGYVYNPKHVYAAKTDCRSLDEGEHEADRFGATGRRNTRHSLLMGQWPNQNY